MASPMAFISYRRGDASQAAQGLHAQLRNRFGPGRVFMDVGSTTVGDVWPERIWRALERATVVLAVIGPGWLTAADQYGRRRLDQPNDWVRREITHAIDAEKSIVPLLVGNMAVMPPAEGLPPELQPLLIHQALTLHDEHWERDVDALAKVLVDTFRFVANDARVVLPQPKIKMLPLSEQELEEKLSTVSGWEPVESMIAGDYPSTRYELRRVYRFRSFPKAMEFMGQAAKVIRQRQHHPRWENQWKTVTVYLTTWDIGNRVTELDIELARDLDRLYEAGSSARDRDG